jgi:uncharacterized protein involved in tellurium resistance
MWFNNCKSEGEVKAEYKNLFCKHKADKELMLQINAAYKTAIDTISNNLPNELKEAAIFAKSLDGLRLELVGSWLWVYGETKKHKEALKNYGFKFSFKHQAWRFTTDPYFRGKETLTDEQIKNKYGVQTI